MQSNSITKHGLDLILKSPKQYWYHYLREDRDEYVPSAATVFDNALRASVLDYAEFKRLYVRKPKYNRTKMLEKHDDDVLIATCAANNQFLIPADRYDSILAMTAAICEHATCKILLNSGNVGETTEFCHPESEAVISVKPHWISDTGLIVNLTSTKDTETTAKDAALFNRHRKAAILMDLFHMPVVFVVIEEKPPYNIQVSVLNDRSIQLGREEYIAASKLYMECMGSGKWGGVSEEIKTISLPEWVFNK